MLGLLHRSRTTGARPRNRVVLRLEGLEWRDNPSDPGTGDPTIVFSPLPSNMPPQIVNFSCEEIGSGVFLISGTVLDESPGGLTVRFGGSTSAAGQTAVTLTEGSFETTVQLRTDGTDSGWITAVVTDAQGLTSEQVQQYVSPTPP